jgi:hypothetical protein
MRVVTQSYPSLANKGYSHNVQHEDLIQMLVMILTSLLLLCVHFLGVSLDLPTRYELVASMGMGMGTAPMTAASTTSRKAGVVRDVPRDPPTSAATLTIPTRTARHPPSTTPTSTTTLASILEDLRGEDATMGDEQQHKKRACSELSQSERPRSEKETSQGTKKVQQTASKSEDKKTDRTGTGSSCAGQQHNGESPFFSLSSPTPATHCIQGPSLPDSDNDSVESAGSVDSTMMLMLC